MEIKVLNGKGFDRILEPSSVEYTVVKNLGWKNPYEMVYLGSWMQNDDTEEIEGLMKVTFFKGKMGKMSKIKAINSWEKIYYNEFWRLIMTIINKLKQTLIRLIAIF